MAIYHLHAQIIGRSSGQSAVAAAAYRSTTRIVDRTTGEISDYTRKTAAIASGIITPEAAPIWAADRAELWNAVEEKENRKNSQFAREINIALPHELNAWYSEQLLKKFCKTTFSDRGLVCDYAIHNPDKKGDQRNRHAHIMVTTRAVTAEGWGEKDREANTKEFLQTVRENWEKICNNGLEQALCKERVSCQTLEAQGVDRTPEIHQGKAATAIERKGEKPERTRTPEPEKKSEEKKSESDRIDREEKRIKTILKMINLDGEGWAKAAPVYKKSLKSWEDSARITATKMVLSELEIKNKADLNRVDHDVKNLEYPSKIYPRKNPIIAWLYKWTDDNGKVYGKYDDYAKAQKKIIDRYTEKRQKLITEKTEIFEETKLIKIMKEAKVTGEKNPEGVNALLNIQQKKRPETFEKIIGIEWKLLAESVEFSEYRGFKNAYEAVKAARVEAVKNEQRQDKKRGQSRGWSR